MRRYQVKRDGMKMDGRLVPTIMKKVNKNGLELFDSISTNAENGLFEVEHKRKQYIVNLTKRTYGCRRWDLTGIPCAHAISTVLYDGGKPKDYG